MPEDGQLAVPSWHLITGEYPPQPGGVSDYTQLLARALSDSGACVHIWAPGTKILRSDGRAIVHSLPDFGATGLRSLSKGLKAVSGPKRLLIQYAASALGFYGMNVGFALWLASWGSDEVWVHFHEVAYAFAWQQRPQRNVLAAVEWWMAQLAAGRADRVFISIPGWRRQLGRHAERAEVLPIPSNIPVEVRLEDIEAIRARLGPGPLVGHFGTYGTLIGNLLRPVVADILEIARDARFLLLGRGGLEFATRLASTHPALASRLVAPGVLTANELSNHLSVCDVLVQPYPDGISGRRTSAMAGLALGKSMVTTTGHLTEDEWASSGAVMLVPVNESNNIVSAVLRLLAAPSQREALGTRARSWYTEHFSIAHSLGVLGCPRTSDKVEPCRNAH
jgi:glycosyltransferase involved in cell wall biosynthesis